MNEQNSIVFVVRDDIAMSKSPSNTLYSVEKRKKSYAIHNE